VNDIGRALKFMADEGHDVICLAAKSNPSKSIKRSDKTSSHGRLTIFRPWASHQFPAEFPEAAALLANKVLDGLIFDVVLCFQHFNYPLIRRFLRLSRQSIPVAVLLENAWRAATEETMSTRLRMMYRLRGFRDGPRFYRWVAKSADSIITCDPGEIGRLADLQVWNPRTEYVPWCTDPGRRRTHALPDRGVAIFAGALAKHKNPSELVAVIRQVLAETPTTRFRLATSRQSTRILVAWRTEFGERFEPYTNLTLTQVAGLMEEAQYGITAAAAGGWGFIGGCWALQTPLVLLHPNSFVQDPASIVQGWEYATPADAVNALLSDDALQGRVRRTGFSQFERYHSADAVGHRLLAVLGSIS